MKDNVEIATDYTDWMVKTGGYARDMTLRDHFAGMAMQGFLADCMAPNCEASTIAKCSFVAADAMLKERNQ